MGQILRRGRQGILGLILEEENQAKGKLGEARIYGNGSAQPQPKSSGVVFHV